MALSYQDYVNGVAQLSPEEQLRLLDVIAAHLRKSLRQTGPQNIMGLAGLGAEAWRDLDVEAYLQQERDSWR